MQKSIFCFLMLLLLSCSEKESQSGITSKKRSNPFYEKAFVLMDNNQMDSAFFYLNKGKDLFLKRNDSFGVGKSYVNMAFIQESIGDNFGCIETSLIASQYFKEKDTAHHGFIFSNYNNLGIASSSLKNYKDAEQFYKKAKPFAKDPIDKMMLQNNLAILFHNQKKYDSAVFIYNKLINSVGPKSDYYPKLLLNYSRSRWFGDQNYNPVKNYITAEKLSQNIDDDWTKDAAYAYLSAYYLNKRPDSSKLYAKKMLTLAKKLKYPVDELEALQNLIKLSDGTEAQQYFDSYSKTQDSLINSQNKAKNQFALIRYESEKAKTENLLLQKEHARHEYQVKVQNLVIGLLVFVFIVIVIITYNWVKKRRERLVLEANNKLQEQRLDFSKRVHDVVANGIYEVMITIENQKDLPKEKILDKLELMYEKSRDLSYDSSSRQEFNEKILTLAGSFDNDNTRIIIIGNDPDFWESLAPSFREELFQVIRELLVNMKKHSFATQVILRFSRENDLFQIFYSDNGVGLSEDFVEKNGFRNMKTRLEDIGAKMKIEDSNIGLKVSINITKLESNKSN
ncbi:tetratricopeptide repeat-containing sensor histidine kinase [Epilithonimonas arachidiradicis]|nr:tetratricopeptide repeat-containing sensor histidine kinase [Epilithonimonas arachidiradicis]